MFVIFIASFTGQVIRKLKSSCLSKELFLSKCASEYLSSHWPQKKKGEQHKLAIGKTFHLAIVMTYSARKTTYLQLKALSTEKRVRS